MPFAGKFFGLFDDEIPYLGNRRTVQVSGFDTTQFPFRGVGISIEYKYSWIQLKNGCIYETRRCGIIHC